MAPFPLDAPKIREEMTKIYSPFLLNTVALIEPQFIGVPRFARCSNGVKKNKTAQPKVATDKH